MLKKRFYSHVGILIISKETQTNIYNKRRNREVHTKPSYGTIYLPKKDKKITEYLQTSPRKLKNSIKKDVSYT